MMQDTWQLQEAKAKFSEVVRRAAKRPQTITMRGDPVAVLVPYGGGVGPGISGKGLIDFFRNSPIGDIDLEIMPRHELQMREVDFE